MGIREELEKFAKANGITKENGIYSLDLGKETIEKMISSFNSKVDETKSQVPDKEKLEQMMNEGRDLLKMMIKNLLPDDETRKFSEDILTRTEKFSKPAQEEEVLEEIPEKVYISWKDMTDAITNNVAPKILKKFPNIDTILCVTRGGLVPAGILSYALNIKNIINIKVESYDDDNAQKEMKLTPLSKRDIKTLAKSSGILIVDDILDTGDTIVEVYEYLEYIGGNELVDKTEFFSIVTKDYTDDEFCVYNLTGDERWVEFPWTHNE